MASALEIAYGPQADTTPARQVNPQSALAMAYPEESISSMPEPTLGSRVREFFSPVVGETANQTARRIGASGETAATGEEMFQRLGVPRAAAKIAYEMTIGGPGTVAEQGARNIVRKVEGKTPIGAERGDSRRIGPQEGAAAFGIKLAEPTLPKDYRFDPNKPGDAMDQGLEAQAKQQPDITEKIAGEMGKSVGELPGFVEALGPIGAALDAVPGIKAAMEASRVARMAGHSVKLGVTAATTTAAAGGSPKDALKSGATLAAVGPMFEIANPWTRAAVMGGTGAIMPIIENAHAIATAGEDAVKQAQDAAKAKGETLTDEQATDARHLGMAKQMKELAPSMASGALFNTLLALAPESGPLAKKLLTARVEEFMPISEVGDLYRRVKDGTATPEDQKRWQMVYAVVQDASERGVKSAEAGVRVQGTGKKPSVPDWVADTLGIKFNPESASILEDRPQISEPGHPLAPEDVTSPSTPSPTPTADPVQPEERDLSEEEVDAALKSTVVNAGPVTEAGSPSGASTPPVLSAEAPAQTTPEDIGKQAGLRYDGVSGKETGKPMWQWTIADPKDIDHDVTFYTPIGASPEDVQRRLAEKRAEFAAGRTPEAQAEAQKYQTSPEQPTKPVTTPVLPPTGQSRASVFEQAKLEAEAAKTQPAPTVPPKTGIVAPIPLKQAAIKTPLGTFTAPHHPAAINEYNNAAAENGLPGIPKLTREQRNQSHITPQGPVEFGFTDEQGTFVPRDEAAKRAELTNQKLEQWEDFDENGNPLAHSDKVSHEPGSETAISETQQPVTAEHSQLADKLEKDAKFRKAHGVHIDLKPGAEGRIEQIMRDGLTKGMLSDVRPDGKLGWAEMQMSGPRHTKAGDVAYIVPERSERIRQPTKPIAAVRFTRDGQTLFEALRERQSQPTPSLVKESNPQRKAILDDLVSGKIEPVVGETPETIAIWDMMRTLKIPDGWKLSQTIPSVDSFYWEVRDPEGTPVKLTVRDHDVSPARAQQFGYPEVFGWTSDAKDPSKFAEGMTRLEQNLQKYADEWKPTPKFTPEERAAFDKQAAVNSRIARIASLEEQIPKQVDAINRGIRIGNGKPFTTENQRTQATEALQRNREELASLKQERPDVTSSGLSVPESTKAAVTQSKPHPSLVRGSETTPQPPESVKAVPSIASVKEGETPAEVVKQAESADLGKSLRAQKKYLFTEIDKALAEAPEQKRSPETVPTGSIDDSQEAEKQKAFERNKQKFGTVTIEVPGDGTFDILNTKQALAAFKEKAKKFPTQVAKAKGPSQTRTEPTTIPAVAKPTVEDALKTLVRFTTDDETRYTLKHIELTGDQAVVTDGRRLMLVKMPFGKGAAEKPVYLDQNLKPNTSIISNPEMETLAKKKVPDGLSAYPNWKQVVPKASSQERVFGSVDTGETLRMLNQAINLTGERNESVIVYKNPDGSLGIYKGNPDLGEYQSIEGVRNGKALAAYSVFYLRDFFDAARRLGHDKTDWFMSKPVKEKAETYPELAPLTLKSKDGTLMSVIMPMRMDRSLNEGAKFSVPQPVEAVEEPVASTPPETTPAETTEPTTKPTVAKTPAEALHTGQPVKLPKGANAVLVRSTGGGYAKALTKDLDTLKGGGPYTSVKPKKVTFTTAGAPKWGEAQDIKGTIEVVQPKGEPDEQIESTKSKRSGVPARGEAVSSKPTGSATILPDIAKRKSALLSNVETRAGENQRLVALLNRAYMGDSRKFVAVTKPLGLPSATKAENLARAFGKRVVWFRDDSKDGFQGGAIIKNTPPLEGVIFLNAAALHHTSSVASHELTHWMEVEAPELYRPLATFVADHITNVSPYITSLWRKGYRADQVPQEMIADFVQEAMRDPKRYREVMDENPSLFDRIWSWILSKIDALRKVLGYDYSPRGVATTTDAETLKEIRDEVVDALKQYKSSTVGESTLGKPEVMGSQSGDIQKEDKEEPPKIVYNVKDGLVRAKVKSSTGEVLLTTDYLKSKEEAKTAAQAFVEAHQAPPEPPKPPEAPSASPEAEPEPNTPSELQEAIKRHTPGLEAASDIKDGIASLLLPTANSKEHLQAAEILGAKLGAMHRRSESANAQIRPWEKKFNKTGLDRADVSPKDNAGIKFMSAMSTGKPVDPQFKGAMEVAQKEFDKRIDLLEKADAPLQTVRENYFPGVWTKESRLAFNAAMEQAVKDGLIPGDLDPNQSTPAQRESVKKLGDQYLQDGTTSDKDMLPFFSRNPLRGRESFRKGKVFDDILTAAEFGLRPVSYNPMELVKLKLSEMDRSIMAHQFFQDLKAKGKMVVIDPYQQVPDNWVKVNDRYGTIFGPPTVSISEHIDKQVYDGLMRIADNLGIKHDRAINIGGTRLGYSEQGGSHVVTRFATETSVLAHEIGHQLDHKFGLWQKLTQGKSGGIRGFPQDQLRAIADIMVGGRGAQGYTHKKEEKIAQMIEAYVHAPEQMKEVAPKLYEWFDDFVKSTPEIETMAEIRPGLKMKGMASEKYVGLPIIGYRIVPKEVGDIVNNYLSSSLYNNRYFGTLYKGWMSTANILNQSQLGLGSAFHAGFTTAEVQVSAGAGLLKDLYGVVRGNRGVSDLSKTVGKWVTAMGRTPVVGDKVLNAWRNPDAVLDPKLKQIVKAAELAGGGFTMERGLTTDQTDKLVRDWYSGNKLKAAMRSPVAFTELLAKPIMEYLVPRQKSGIFAELAGRIIEKNPETSLEDLAPQFRQAWNRVDSRLGQVRYDRLFANNTAKNVVQGLVRAPGWSGGTIAELGGAFPDTAKYVRDWARDGKPPEDMPDRVAYTLSLLLTIGLLNALLTYLFTGDKPEGLDYFAFRDGGKDEEGRPTRMLLPSYMKDLVAYAKHPVQTLENKAHPLLAMIEELKNNRDFYGTEIRDPQQPGLKQAGQIGQYVAKQFVPFWIRGAQKAGQQGGSTAKKAAAYVGVMPAPRNVTETPAEETMSSIQAGHRNIGGRTQAQAQRSEGRTEVRRELQRGDQGAIARGLSAGTIQPRDTNRIRKQANETYLQRGITSPGVTTEEGMQVWHKASASEKNMLRELLIRKVLASHTLKPDQRRQYLAELRSSTGQPSEADIARKYAN